LCLQCAIPLHQGRPPPHLDHTAIFEPPLHPFLPLSVCLLLPVFQPDSL
jgi:hypothetical protein